MVTASGRFRELVSLERARRARNAMNESEIVGWDVVATLFAEVLQPTSTDRAHEIAAASRPASEVLLQFRLRTPVDVRDGDRIVWNGDAFGVEGRIPNPAAGETMITGRFLSGTDGR